MTLAMGFGLLACILHFLFFLMESVLWNTTKVQKIFGVSAEMANSRELKSFAFNMGFYNFFLSLCLLTGMGFSHCGCSGGNLLWHAAALFMLGAGVVLFVSSGNRKLVAALVQGLPPVLSLICLHLGL